MTPVLPDELAHAELVRAMPLLIKEWLSKADVDDKEERDGSSINEGVDLKDEDNSGSRFDDDSEYDDYDWDKESEKDFTACAAEDCGYCGHC